MADSSAVVINRHGNVLVIEPAALSATLGPHLVWKERKRNPRSSYDKQEQYYEYHNHDLFTVRNDQIITYTGFLPRIEELLKSWKISYRINNVLVPQLPAPVTTDLGFMRVGQQEVLNKIWSSSLYMMQVICPTAWGKTEMVAKLARSYPTVPMLVISPSLDAFGTMTARLRGYHIEVGEVNGQKNKPGRVTVCSMSSLMKVNVNDYPIIIFDEVHRSAARNARTVLATVHNSMMIGLTASPTGRTDQAEPVIEGMFGPPTCEIPYDAAVENGLVVPMVVLMLDTPGRPLGEMDPQDKSRHGVWRNSARTAMIASVAESVSSMGQTLLITSVLEHGLRLKRDLPEWPLVYGTVPNDAEQKPPELLASTTLELDGPQKVDIISGTRCLRLQAVENDVFYTLDSAEVQTVRHGCEVYLNVRAHSQLHVAGQPATVDIGFIDSIPLTPQQRRARVRAAALKVEMGHLSVPAMSSRDRAEMAEQFRAGQILKAISTFTWSTAVDFPRLQFVIRADGQQDKINSVQIPGRAARISDGKTVGILIDAEDEFDKSLARRKESRMAIYRSRKWTIMRNLTAEQVVSVSRDLIQTGWNSSTASRYATLSGKQSGRRNVLI